MTTPTLAPVSQHWRTVLLLFVYGSILAFATGAGIAHHSGEEGGFLLLDWADAVAPYVFPGFLLIWLAGAVLAFFASGQQMRRRWRWVVSALMLPLLAHLVLASRNIRDCIAIVAAGFALIGVLFLAFGLSNLESLQSRLDGYWAPHLRGLVADLRAAEPGIEGAPYIRGKALVIQDGRVVPLLHPSLRATNLADVGTIISVEKGRATGVYGQPGPDAYVGFSSTSDVTIVDRLEHRVVGRRSFRTDPPPSIEVSRGTGRRVDDWVKADQRLIGRDSWPEASAWLNALPRR